MKTYVLSLALLSSIVSAMGPSSATVATMSSYINKSIPETRNILFVDAMKNSDYNTAAQLLKEGAYPNAKLKGNPVIFHEIFNGKLNGVKLLVQNKANLKVVNEAGQTPLELAKILATVYEMKNSKDIYYYLQKHVYPLGKK